MLLFAQIYKISLLLAGFSMNINTSYL